MPVIHPKVSASICLTGILLLATCRVCPAQSSAPQPEVADATTSPSLPDAPEPQQKDPIPGPPLPPKPPPVTFLGTPKRILFDQKAIWTSPLHLKPADAIWLLPLAATTGTMIGSDQHTMNSLIHINPNDQQHFKTLSNATVGALGLLPAGMYLWSLDRYALLPR